MFSYKYFSNKSLCGKKRPKARTQSTMTNLNVPPQNIENGGKLHVFDWWPKHISFHHVTYTLVKSGPWRNTGCTLRGDKINYEMFLSQWYLISVLVFGSEIQQIKSIMKCFCLSGTFLVFGSEIQQIQKYDLWSKIWTW